MSIFAIIVIAIAIIATYAPTVRCDGLTPMSKLGENCWGDQYCYTGSCWHGSSGFDPGRCGCLPGQYADRCGATCSWCPDGTVPNGADLQTCDGRYVGLKSCTPCPAGTYSDRAAVRAERCNLCPVNSYSRPGAATCSVCPVGKYSQPAAPECMDCPSPTQVANPVGIMGCGERYPSLFNNGTLNGGPSNPLVPNTYPSRLYATSKIIIWNHPSGDSNKHMDFYYQGQLVTTSGNMNRGYIVSPNFQWFVYFQTDGNICKYRGSGPNNAYGAVWCSAPPTNPSRYIHTMLADGNLCTYHADPNGQIVSGLWCMFYSPGPLVAGSYMEIFDDGRFCRMHPNGSVLGCY